MLILILWTLVIATCLIMFFKRSYSKFRRAGVNHLPPIAPFGNLLKTTFRLEHLTTTSANLYNSFPNDRFIGMYEFVNPVVMVRDLDLIKQITVKDFEHFVDHRVLIDENNDKLFGRNLFSLKGGKWRDMRSTSSPAFTSSKIRLMVPFMWEVGDQMSEVLKQKIKACGANSFDIEVRDLTTRYANDVIATCAFGIKVNSHADENNEFYQRGKNATNFTFTQLLKFFGFTSFPRIMNALKVSIFPKSAQNFFRSLVTGVMKDREEKNIIRPDMIHLLMEAKKGVLTHDDTPSEDAGFATVEESSIGKTKSTRVWEDDDLLAQAVLFFIAGFDTVSTAMTFLLCEMSLNPDIQEKLVKEIRETDTKHNGKIDYKTIQQMEYMDMVVSEALRKWVPGAILDRVCVKDYNLGRANKKSTQDYIIRKGEGIWLPVWGIHHNPEYFPEPEKFDPERFSHQNRDNIKPFTYFPFGLGPRNCIGSRFALCEVKVILYQLLRDFQVVPSDKLILPIQLSTETFNLRVKGGAWITLKNRNNKV